MKVNGFQIQQAIQESTKDRDLAESRFAGSIKAFPGEKKPHPLKLAEEIAANERRIARLQTVQARYNLAVTVDVQGESMTLQEAVKLKGGAERIEKQWREAAKEETDRYGGTVRDKDSIVAERQVDHEKCAELARDAARRVRSITYAIRCGNATEIDLPGDVDL